ncbi:hypothetical protein [Rhizobium leguminosarum]|uniref:hypothetical protein n=1 Tax=Rhizobium leguminosarum TaxID=384 RepID=UPI001C92350B|nr:hypothetical protein [Rhizobium leguminosarum]
MPTLNTTPNRAYSEPFFGNELSVDVGRIISALRAIDTDVAAAFAQIVAKANSASPSFTGVPTTPTAAPGTDTGQIASTAFVHAAVVALIDSSPGALDTLNELAAALGDDPNFAATMTALIGTKASASAALTSLAAYNTNGILTQTAANTFTGRTLTGTSNEVTVTNGNGVSGNPTISLPSALTLTGKTITGGGYVGPYISGPVSSIIFKGLLWGLTLSNNVTDAANDIDIAVGVAASDASIPHVLELGSALTKRLDAAWAVGTNQGGLDTGSIANTTYHIWLIQRSDTGVVDALFSTSATSPTMPTNYDRKRRIGAILREAGAIAAFKQHGDFFEWTVPAIDVTTVTNGVSTLRTLRVPIGSVVRGSYTVRIANTAGAISGVNHWDPALGSTLPHSAIGYAHMFVNTAVSQAFATHLETMTNTSGQIYNRANGAALTSYELMTEGFWDTRGK